MGMRIKRKPKRKTEQQQPTSEILDGDFATKDEVAELSKSVDELTEQITSVVDSNRTVVDTMADLQKALKGSEKTPAERQEITERQLQEARSINTRNKRIIPVWGGNVEKVDANYLFKGVKEDTPPKVAKEIVTKVLTSPTDSETIKEFQRLSDRVKVASGLLEFNRGDVTRTKWYKEYQQFLEDTEISKILTIANATDNFIPEGWSMEILTRFYQELEVATAFMDFDMPQSPFTWPLMGRGQAKRRTRATASARGTAANEYPENSSDTNKVTFEAETLSVRQDLEEEFVEDSADMLMNLLTDIIIPETMAEGIESALVNGDTTKHTDSGRDAGHAADDIELSWHGLRKLAMLQKATLDIGDSSGTFDFGDLSAVIAKGGKYLIKPKNSFWVMENNTYTRTTSFDEVETYDKNPIPTNINGVVNTILGRPVLISGEWPLTHTDGYVNSTAGNNTKGGFLCANAKQFAIGSRRRERVEQMKDILTGFYYVVATCRLDFQALENLQTEYTPVALGFNVPL